MKFELAQVCILITPAKARVVSSADLDSRLRGNDVQFGFPLTRSRELYLNLFDSRGLLASSEYMERSHPAEAVRSISPESF